MNKIQEWERPIEKHHDKKFRYMMLGRLKSDCDYFLGYGNRYEPRLWAGTVRKQIKKMRALHKSFGRKEKPQWLTLKQIREYEKLMVNRKKFFIGITKKRAIRIREFTIKRIMCNGRYMTLID